MAERYVNMVDVELRQVDMDLLWRIFEKQYYSILGTDETMFWYRDAIHMFRKFTEYYGDFLCQFEVYWGQQIKSNLEAAAFILALEYLAELNGMD